MGQYPLVQMVITVSSPGQIDGKEGRYVLAEFYGALLGMKIVSDGWLKISKERGNPFELTLDGDGWSDARPPKWRDPAFPQQLHLDIGTPDLEVASSLVADTGAALLDDPGTHRVYAD